MSRYAAKALDYSPEEGQLAQALLQDQVGLMEDETVDTGPMHACLFGTFLPTEEIDQSTIVDERESFARHSGLFMRPHAVHTWFRPRFQTGVVGTIIAAVGGRIREDAYVPVARWKGPLSRIEHEVGRLTDGWAGRNTRAPSDQIVRAMQTLAGLLPAGATEPSAEVDPDDGTVALTWTSAEKDESFTTTIFNSGKIGGAHAALGKRSMPAWIVPVQDYRKLSAHLNQPRLLAIICG